MVKYVCAKIVADSTKLRLVNGQKSKFLWGSMPLDPLVCRMLLYTDTYLPPNNPYNLILPPLGQKAEINPALHETQKQ